MHLAYRVLGADFPTSVDKENANYQQNLRYQTYEDNKSDINALRKKKKKRKTRKNIPFLITVAWSNLYIYVYVHKVSDTTLMICFYRTEKRHVKGKS